MATTHPTVANPAAIYPDAFVRWSDADDGWVWSVLLGNEVLASGTEHHEGDAWTHALAIVRRNAPGARWPQSGELPL
jgi:hypothetical protein